MTIYEGLILVAFVGYNISLVSYAAYVFEYRENKVIYTITTCVINTLIVYGLFSFLTLDNEYVFLLVYLVVYGIQLKYMCNRGNWVLFFGVFSFALNLFSRRLIVLSILALANGMTMGEVYNDETLNFWMNFIPLIIAPPYIHTTKKMLKRDLLHLLFSDKKNLRFAVLLMAGSFGYLLVINFFVGTPNADLGFVIMYLISGLLSSVSYHLAMLFTYTFSKLKLSLIKFDKLSKSVEAEEAELNDISERSRVDKSTGVYVRDVALECMEKYKAEHTVFHVIFMDMDGLKTVNDKFGHSEGDFYISQVASIINAYFHDAVVSRMGGDEFLVVSKGDDFDVTQKAMGAYLECINISKNHSKEYSTSISYGIQRAERNTALSVEEIVSRADKKMYAFKKAHDKQRKTVSIKDI